MQMTWSDFSKVGRIRGDSKKGLSLYSGSEDVIESRRCVDFGSSIKKNGRPHRQSRTRHKFYGDQRKSSLLQSKKEPGVPELLEINSKAAEIGVPLRNTWYGPYPTPSQNIVRGVPHFGCRCRHCVVIGRDGHPFFESEMHPCQYEIHHKNAGRQQFG